MADLSDDDLKALRERLTELGQDNVRSLLASDGFPPTYRLEVARWLAEQAGADREPAREPHGPARHRRLGKRSVQLRQLGDVRRDPPRFVAQSS